MTTKTIPAFAFTSHTDEASLQRVAAGDLSGVYFSPIEAPLPGAALVGVGSITVEIFTPAQLKVRRADALRKQLAESRSQELRFEAELEELAIGETA